jgi:hypothetical protein
MTRHQITKEDIELAKLMVEVADGKGIPIDDGYRALAVTNPKPPRPEFGLAAHLETAGLEPDSAAYTAYNMTNGDDLFALADLHPDERSELHQRLVLVLMRHLDVEKLSAMVGAVILEHTVTSVELYRIVESGEDPSNSAIGTELAELWETVVMHEPSPRGPDPEKSLEDRVARLEKEVFRTKSESPSGPV